MERRTFGGTGRSVPVVGQGTWRLDPLRRAKAVDILRYGCELGMTHVDTAELYGRGAVERRIVRQVLRGRREEVFLASKVRPPHTDYRSTIRACERSLRRLRTDVLDLYLLHWRSELPLEETLAAFERLREQGKIRAYGVSNFTLAELQEAVRLAGPGRIACNQVAYSIVNRLAERDMLPWTQQHGIALVAYSPLGSGRFPSEGCEARRVLTEIAEDHRATPHQVALAFLLRQPNVFVIPKHSSRRHARANARAAELVLADEQLLRIDSALPIRNPQRAAPRRRSRAARLRGAVSRWGLGQESLPDHAQ